MKKLDVKFERVKSLDISKLTIAFAERGAIGTTPEAIQEMERLSKRSKEEREIQTSAKSTQSKKLQAEYLASLNES
jgi:hypothetical protein